MSTPTVLFPGAPARTDRQITALRAGVTLLERLRGIAVLVLHVEADFAPDLPVRLDAQVSVQDDDPGPADAVRLDRLQLAAAALDAPITPTWTTDGQQAFALTGVVVDGVPVQLWAAFTDPDVITRAHSLAVLGRRAWSHPMSITDAIAAYRTSGKALRAMDRGPRPTRNFGATEKAYAHHHATRAAAVDALVDAGRRDLVGALITAENLPPRIADSPGPRPELRRRLNAARATLRAAQNQQ